MVIQYDKIHCSLKLSKHDLLIHAGEVRVGNCMTINRIHTPVLADIQYALYGFPDFVIGFVD